MKTPMLNDPDFLTSNEAGAMVRVSSRTLQRWALEDATFPVTRIGRILRFERGALLAWLARSTQGARKRGATRAKPASDIDKPTDRLSVVA